MWCHRNACFYQEVYSKIGFITNVVLLKAAEPIDDIEDLLYTPMFIKLKYA